MIILLLKKIVSDIRACDQLRGKQRSVFLVAMRRDAEQVVRTFFLQAPEAMKECTPFRSFGGLLFAYAKIHKLGKVGVIIDPRVGFRMFSLTGPALSSFLKTGDCQILHNSINTHL